MRGVRRRVPDLPPQLRRRDLQQLQGLFPEECTGWGQSTLVVVVGGLLLIVRKLFTSEEEPGTSKFLLEMVTERQLCGQRDRRVIGIQVQGFR